MCSKGCHLSRNESTGARNLCRSGVERPTGPEIPIVANSYSRWSLSSDLFFDHLACRRADSPWGVAGSTRNEFRAPTAWIRPRVRAKITSDFARTLRVAALVGYSFVAASLQTLTAAPVTTLAFSPDGAVLVSNGDRRIDIRSPKDAVIQRHVACDFPKITTLAFAPHGRVLAVGGGEPGVRGDVILLSWPEGKMLHRLTHHTDLVTSVAFDAEGKRLGVASSDHTARIWQFKEKTEPAIAFAVTGHAGPVLSIAFSPSGQSIVTASADRSLKVWASDDGHLLRSFSHHTEAIHALAFRPRAANDATPATCASASDDRSVRVWQPEIGRMVRIVRQHEGPAFALAWSTDGSALFSAGKEGIIRRIDGASDVIQTSWRAHDDWIYALALSSDGATLASGDWKGKVRLHDLRNLDTHPPDTETRKP